MDFFLHYVGRSGSARDFPKTVFTERPTSLVLERVPDNHPQKGYLLLQLGEHFPSGRWNCWGVPSGATPAIGRLSKGDVFLLMETHAERGPIPALGVVEVYLPQRFPALSRALWGDGGFPYILFFRTEPLSLTWPELRHRLGYQPTYKGPIGQVQRINDAKVRHAGGPSRLLEWLRSKATGTGPIEYSLQPPTSSVAERDGWIGTVKAHDDIITASIEDEPKLTDDAEPQKKVVHQMPRSEAFRNDVKTLYGGKCAVCSLGIVGPFGEVEVQSAHIYPRHKGGRDDLRNGLCLCRLHHWALDVGWFSLSDSRQLIVRDDLPSNPDYDFIRDYKRRTVRAPSASHFTPHPIYLSAHRRMVGLG